LLNNPINFIKNIFFNKCIVSFILILSILFSFTIALTTFPKDSKAISRYHANGSELITGTEMTKTYSNAGS